MTAPFYLKCMGYPELRAPDGQCVLFKVRKHLASLVYLAVERRQEYSRGHMTELLWDRSWRRGRHSLSVAVSDLRRILGKNVIEGTSNTIRFAQNAVTLDLDKVKGSRCTAPLSSCPAEDRFLGDFEIPNAARFMHWRDSIQARLLPSIQSTLLERVNVVRRAGDAETLSHYADRLLALDPLSEDGIRAWVDSRVISGDRVGALRIYEKWRATLYETLGAKPSESLESLALRLRRPSRPHATVRAGRPELRDSTEDGFVGRQDERKALFDVWDAPGDLPDRHIVVEGDRGVGKSTLVRRFATAVELEGAITALVRCYELEQRIPFGIIGALVDSLIDHPGAAGTDSSALAELGRVVPRVRGRFPGVPAPRPTEVEAAPVLIAEGVIALLETLTEQQPVLLVIDDYPQSDEASLGVLHRLLRRKSLDRLRMILIARPPEGGEPPEACRIRRNVAALGLRRMRLGPLPEGESVALLETLIPPRQPIKPPARRAILKAAAGNPLSLRVIVQDWLTHGEAATVLSMSAMGPVGRTSGIEWTASATAEERPAPSLSRHGRIALWLATILGSRLNDASFLSLGDLTPDTLIGALAELIGWGILRNVDGRLEFSNEIMRARLYLQVPASIRAGLHERVARRLIEARLAGEEVPGLEIAWHSIRSGQPNQAIPYLLEGARTALAKGAADEAVWSLSTALEHLIGTHRVRASIVLAEILQQMDDWKASVQVLEQIEGGPVLDAGLAQTHKALLIAGRRGACPRPSRPSSFLRGRPSRAPTSGRARGAGPLGATATRGSQE